MLSQLNKDIDYCTHVLGCNAEQTDELISAAEALGVNAEYFCEEFIVAPEGENAMKYQREDFIDLDAFNAYHEIYFEEEEDNSTGVELEDVTDDWYDEEGNLIP